MNSFAFSSFSERMKVEIRDAATIPSDGLTSIGVVVTLDSGKWLLHWSLPGGALTLQNSPLLGGQDLHFSQQTRLPKRAPPASC